MATEILMSFGGSVLTIASAEAATQLRAGDSMQLHVRGDQRLFMKLLRQDEQFPPACVDRLAPWLIAEGMADSAVQARIRAIEMIRVLNDEDIVDHSAPAVEL